MPADSSPPFSFDPSRPDRGAFLRLALTFEGSLVAVAYALGWLADIDPFAQWRWSGDAVSYGMLGTLPLLLVFFWTYHLSHPELRKIKRFLLGTLAPQLAACRGYELLAIAAVAGLGEEAVFRGVLQPWAEQHWGNVGGLLASNLLFGLVHCVTLWYGVLAFLTGLYLGVMLDANVERNLLAPVVIHGLYDFVAFLAVVQAYRCTGKGEPL